MIKLIKTMSGHKGLPIECPSCTSVHFIRIGMAWSCGDCGLYFPKELQKTIKNETYPYDSSPRDKDLGKSEF